jgi:uncharacterized protein YabE (DUF348 family)
MTKLAITPHRNHIFFVAALMALALFTIVAMSVRSVSAEAVVQSAEEHIITLHDDGVEKGFITKAKTLREAFASEGIRIDERDVTEPSMDAKLVAASYEVNIYRARMVIIRDNGAETKVVSAYRTGKQIAKQAGITLHDEDIAELKPSTDIVTDGAAEVMTIKRATPIEFIFYGKTLKVYTQASTIGAMLEEKNIKVRESDTLRPSASTKLSANMRVELWKNGEQVVTVEEDVAFDTHKKYDMNQDKSYRKVETVGETGKRTVTYRYIMRNGDLVEKQELSAVVTKQPVREVVVIGGKNNYSGSLNEWLYALRMCETHGNYATNTGNGFYGAYQFMPSTWNSIARKTGRGDLVGVLPSNASPADQDAMIIANTNMTAGLVTQNPGCYSSTGISNKPPAQ